MTTKQRLTDDQAADIFEAGDGFEPAESTNAIADAVADRDRAQTAIDDAVTAARAAGATWAEIGAALGVTHQAAIKRYSGRTRDRA